MRHFLIFTTFYITNMFSHHTARHHGMSINLSINLPPHWFVHSLEVDFSRRNTRGRFLFKTRWQVEKNSLLCLETEKKKLLHTLNNNKRVSRPPQSLVLFNHKVMWVTQTYFNIFLNVRELFYHDLDSCGEDSETEHLGRTCRLS